MDQSINRRFSDRMRIILSMALAVFLLSACIFAPVAPAPTTALTEARQAIATAEQAGARQYAGAELDEAQQKLLLAEKAVNSEDMKAAERLAQESMIVAELASARTESAKALEINLEMNRSIDALIEEMERVGDEQ